MKNVLCIDAGNTRIKFAAVTPSRVITLGTIDTADALAAGGRIARRFPVRARTANWDGVAVSSVVPPLNQHLRQALRTETGAAPLFARHSHQFPFRIRVRNPADLGCDRLCAAAGAVGNGTRVIVVDVGSAITVDLVDRSIYRGGLIMPGPSISVAALSHFARRLPRLDYSSVKRPFPDRRAGTRHSMILGASIGTIGAIKEAVRTLQREASGPTRTIVTGGAAPGLRKAFPPSWRLDANVVHRGLHMVWCLNHHPHR